MPETARYPFIERERRWGKSSLAPLLPLILTNNALEVQVLGLLDTGSSNNVLPYQLGIELGADWQEQLKLPPLAGNLKGVETRGLVLTASVADFEPVRLVFAWTNSNQHPLILGQQNFFMQFDVFFSRSREFFEIQPKQKDMG